VSNLLPNPGCELASPAITLSGLAERNTDDPHTGSYAVMLFTRKGEAGKIDDESEAEWPSFKVDVGKQYHVKYWYSESGNATDIAPLLTEIDPGTGSFGELKTHTSSGGQLPHRLQSGLLFTAAGGITARFRVRSLETASPLIIDRWYIDDIVIEESMAVKLAERGVAAVIAILQSDLATELAAIDTERGDSITMDAPAAGTYYHYPRAAIQGATCHVEVFEEEFEFTEPYSDAAHQRATYELPITIRLTHFNRANYSIEDMVTRSRRYGAGVFNVINKNHTLGGTDDAIQVAVVQRVQAQWITEGEPADKIVKTVDTVQVLLRCEEDQT